MKTVIKFKRSNRALHEIKLKNPIKLKPFGGDDD